MRKPVLLGVAFQAAALSPRAEAEGLQKCPLRREDEPSTPYSDDSDIAPCYYTNPILNKAGVGDP